MEAYTILQTQYEWVQGSRAVLLEYCQGIAPELLLRENSGFGRGGSIRNLLVHIGTTYDWWLAKQALGRDPSFPQYTDKPDLAACRQYLEYIDGLVLDFLSHFRRDYGQALSLDLGDAVVESSPLQLFTHVITHEYHHKGQILSMSRQLGYIPVDTDVMR